MRLPATIFRGDFEPRFALKVAYKDITLARELAERYDVPLNVAAECERQMAEAMQRGWGDREASIYLSLQEEKAGVRVRVKGEEGERRGG